MTNSEIVNAARAVVGAEGRAVIELAEQIGPEFERLVQLIMATPGRVVTCGSGTSGAVARRMAHLLSVCGTPAFSIDPGDALHGTLGSVVSGDILIALSKGGGSAEVNECARRAKARGATVVAVTATPESTFAETADLVVTLSVPAGVDPGEVIAMGSTVAVSAWSDALATVLLRVRGYDWADVLFTHPSGAVGQLGESPPPLPPLPLLGTEPAQPSSVGSTVP